MSVTEWIIWAVAGAGVWVVVAWACRGMMENPRGDVWTGLLYWLTRGYVRVVHRVRIVGAENVPDARRGARIGSGAGSRGGLVVAANHTAGIDPMLIQSACMFEVRWMMGRDMLAPALMWMWEWARVIPVSRVWVEGEERTAERQSGKAANEEGSGGRAEGATRGDAQGALEAIRHLRAGGVLGVFPEGRIGDVPGRLRAFLPGVGVIVKKTGAAVLPVVITGTPRCESAWGSLLRPSRAVVRFLPVVEYGKMGLEAGEIVENLRGRMAEGLAPKS